MTQEQKELLLKDLCARLPYDTVCQVEFKSDGKYESKNMILSGIFKDEAYFTIENGSVYSNDYKPYLLPLSSLTEEQRNNISKLLIDTQNEFSPYGEINMKGCDNLFICSVKSSNALINYCLANHLDINGLIDKGLAIDATGLNIYRQ